MQVGIATIAQIEKMLANAGAESTSPAASLLILLLQAGEGKKTAGQDFEEQVSFLSFEEKEKVSRIHSMCEKETACLI